MTTIAIIGPGAIGGILAAWLAQDPEHEVSVCARTPFDRLEVETPSGAITASPRVVTDPADAQPVDWVLVATKAYEAERAAHWFPAVRRLDTPDVVLQIGVVHVDLFSSLLPSVQRLPAVIAC